MANLKVDKKLLAKNKNIEGVRDVEYWLFFMKENIMDLQQEKSQRNKMISSILPMIYFPAIILIGFVYGGEAAFVAIIAGVFAMVILFFVLKLVFNILLGKINTDFSTRSFKYLYHFLLGLKNEIYNYQVKLKLNTEPINTKKCQLPDSAYTLPDNLPDNVKIRVYETGRAVGLFRYWDGSKGQLTIIERMIEKEKRSIGRVSRKHKVKYKRKHKFFILLELLLPKENYTVKPTIIEDEDGLSIKVKELKDKNIVVIKHKIKYDPSGIAIAGLNEKLNKPNQDSIENQLEDNLNIINASLNQLFEKNIIIRNSFAV